MMFKQLPFILLMLGMLLYTTVANAALRTRNVEYRQGSTVLEGFLAYDDSKTGKRPGILIVHEWKGISSYERGRAKQLARLGYIAFVADIYGKGVRPTTSEEAGKIASTYRNDRALLRARAQAGLDILRRYENVDPKRIAAIGYCFGGTTVLELARSGADIAGVVSFHGGLDTPNPDDARNIRGKVLVLTGGDDPRVPPAQVNVFIDEMRAANVDWQIVSYGGTVHSFTNPASGNTPSTGGAYNAQADRRSWQTMRAFFNEIFARPAK